MKLEFYYQKVKIIYYILLSIGSVFLVGGFIALLFRDTFDFIYLVCLLLRFGFILILCFGIYFFEIVNMIIYVNIAQKKCEFEKLNTYLSEIDIYFQPPLNGDLYIRKKILLTTYRISTLISLNKIKEANEIYTKFVLDLKQKFTLQEEIDFSIIFIQIQIEKNEVELVETEIEQCKELINNIVKKKEREENLKLLLYMELRLSYLKEEYCNLDVKINEYLTQANLEFTKITLRFFLGEIYLKQGEKEKAKEQFAYVLEHNEKHFRFKEAQIYYKHLEGLDEHN